MNIHKVKLHIASNLGHQEIMDLIGNALHEHVDTWSADIGLVLEVDGPEKEESEYVPSANTLQAIADAVQKSEGLEASVYEVVGERRFGPLASACEICNNRQDSCANLEFSKMQAMASTADNLIVSVICEHFSSL